MAASYCCTTNAHSRHLSQRPWLLRRVFELEHGVVQVGVELVLHLAVLLQALASENLRQLAKQKQKNKHVLGRCRHAAVHAITRAR